MKTAAAAPFQVPSQAVFGSSVVEAPKMVIRKYVCSPVLHREAEGQTLTRIVNGKRVASSHDPLSILTIRACGVTFVISKKICMKITKFHNNPTNFYLVYILVSV